MAGDQGEASADGARAGQRRREEDEDGSAPDVTVPRQRRRLDDGGGAADGARQPGDRIQILHNEIVARLGRRAGTCNERNAEVTEMCKRLASIQHFPESEYMARLEIAKAAEDPLKADRDAKKAQYLEAFRKYEEMEKFRLQVMRDFHKDKNNWEQDQLFLLEEIWVSLDKYAPA